MTLIVIAQVGCEEFLKHARHVHAMQEIAHFYGTDLSCAENLYQLLEQLARSYTHSECFYYAFYFAAWVKNEVPSNQRIFKKFGEQINERIAVGGSLQSTLKDIVSIVGYLKFRRFFDAMGVNRVHLFLENLQIKSS